MQSNFEFLKTNPLTADYFTSATQAGYLVQVKSEGIGK